MIAYIAEVGDFIPTLEKGKEKKTTRMKNCTSRDIDNVDIHRLDNSGASFSIKFDLEPLIYSSIHHSAPRNFKTNGNIVYRRKSKINENKM